MVTNLNLKHSDGVIKHLHTYSEHLAAFLGRGGRRAGATAVHPRGSGMRVVHASAAHDAAAGAQLADGAAGHGVALHGHPGAGAGAGARASLRPRGSRPPYRRLFRFVRRRRAVVPVAPHERATRITQPATYKNRIRYKTQKATNPVLQIRNYFYIHTFTIDFATLFISIMGFRPTKTFL